jgi:hypothetical protein
LTLSEFEHQAANEVCAQRPLAGGACSRRTNKHSRPSPVTEHRRRRNIEPRSSGPALTAPAWAALAVKARRCASGRPPRRSGGSPPRSAHASPRAAGAVKANPQTATATLASTRHGRQRQRRGLCPRAPGPHHESEPRRRRPHRRPETPRSARRPSTRSAGTARADHVKGAKRRRRREPLT